MNANVLLLLALSLLPTNNAWGWSIQDEPSQGTPRHVESTALAKKLEATKAALAGEDTIGARASFNRLMSAHSATLLDRETPEISVEMLAELWDVASALELLEATRDLGSVLHCPRMIRKVPRLVSKNSMRSIPYAAPSRDMPASSQKGNHALISVGPPASGSSARASPASPPVRYSICA